MSRTWQTCSSAVRASLGTPSHEGGAQWRKGSGTAAKTIAKVLASVPIEKLLVKAPAPVARSVR